MLADGGAAATIRSTSRQRSLPQIPSFVETVAGEELCVSVLSMARTDGFENSLAYGKRGPWFASKLSSFFEHDNSIFKPFRRVGEQQIRKKFTEAETVAKSLYAARHHHPDPSGNTVERRPLFTRMFFEYFDFASTRDTPSNVARNSRNRNTCVNRSIIGQHAALSSDSTPTFLGTVAPRGRERGSGDIAGDVLVSEMSTTSSARSGSDANSGRNTSPRRGLAPNDGRASRTRQLNVEFGMSPTASLPPSTGQRDSVNIDRMETGFQFIAASIRDLARSQSVRGLNAINNDIIQTTRERIGLAENGLPEMIYEAYDQKLKDLQEERRQCQWLSNRTFADFDETNNDEQGNIERNGTRDVRRRRSPN
jgi:hypothetical protein